MMSLVRAQLGEPQTRYNLIGVDDAGGPPVPIPNTEVKPCSADDSCPATGCENRKTPILVVSFFIFLSLFFIISHRGYQKVPPFFHAVFALLRIAVFRRKYFKVGHNALASGAPI